MPKKTSRSKEPVKKHWIYKLSIFQHHPHMVPIFTLAVLLAFSGIGFGGYKIVNRNKPKALDTRIVIISHDKQKQTVPSNEPTVGKLLSKLSIHLNQGDRVEPALATKIDQDQFRINIYRAMPIEIVDGTQKAFAFSAATTPRSVAQETGKLLYAEDNLTSVPSESFIKDGALGQRIVIDRATPVNFNLYGTPVVIRTHAKTLRDLLKEKNIKLTKGDQLVPAPTTLLSDNIQVAIIRNGTKVETVTEDIAMPVQTINDNSLAYGTSAIRQKGAAGKKTVTYQLQLQNNQVIAKTSLQEVIIQAPVTQIMVVGTSLSGIKGDMAYAGIGPGDYTYADYIISHESGWCPTKMQGQYGGCPPLTGDVPSYGGYGLCQSTPGSKMASAGADWATNPVTQLKWCTGYAVGRYGSWGAAYNHWLSSHNW